MPRLESDISISVRFKNIPRTYRIELIQKPTNGLHYWVRFDGRNSKKIMAGTPTEVTDKLRQLLSLHGKENGKKCPPRLKA